MVLSSPVTFPLIIVSLVLLLRHYRAVGFLRRCVEEKLVMEGILLRGPAGSGKSALIKVEHITSYL